MSLNCVVSNFLFSKFFFDTAICLLNFACNNFSCSKILLEPNVKFLPIFWLTDTGGFSKFQRAKFDKIVYITRDPYSQFFGCLRGLKIHKDDQNNTKSGLSDEFSLT